MSVEIVDSGKLLITAVSVTSEHFLLCVAGQVSHQLVLCHKTLVTVWDFASKGFHIIMA